MHCVWSNLADGTKQKWEFTGEYEHLLANPKRPILDSPRRLSWRECAAIQTFPTEFEPSDKLERKFEQIGNAIPPALFETLFSSLIDESGLKNVSDIIPIEQLSLKIG